MHSQYNSPCKPQHRCWNCLSCYALTIQSSSHPLSRENLVDVVRCATSLGLYTPMMVVMVVVVVVVATTETCWNMDWVCENFRIINGLWCVFLEIFRQIAWIEQFILQSSFLPLLVLFYVCAFCNIYICLCVCVYREAVTSRAIKTKHNVGRLMDGLIGQYVVRECRSSDTSEYVYM